MKLRVEVNGEAYTLDLQQDKTQIVYKMVGGSQLEGIASVEEITPDVFSVLVENRSVVVHLITNPEGIEAWAGPHRHLVALADPRDKAATSAKAKSKGPVELRAQMPGKIIKFLEAPGAAIKAGQGLLVVEAMKMQNEVKSPKDGTLGKIHVAEGATVAAGDLLAVVV